MLLPQVFYTAVARVEVGVAKKAGVAVVKAARAKVVVSLNFWLPAPPCRRCCQPQGLVLPMLLPQVLSTAVARVEQKITQRELYNQLQQILVSMMKELSNTFIH